MEKPTPDTHMAPIFIPFRVARSAMNDYYVNKDPVCRISWFK